MATSGELIEITAHALKIPLAVVTTYYRSLRQAGLVSKSGRGPSAAKMTAQDAATLLIACGSARFETVPAALITETMRLIPAHSAYGGDLKTGMHRVGYDGWVLEAFDIPGLKQLQKRHTLLAGLTRLLEMSAAGDFYRIPCPKTPGMPTMASFDVTFSWPEETADVCLTLIRSGEFYREQLLYEVPGGSGRSGGMGIRRVVPHGAFEMIAEVILAEGEA